MYVAHFFLELCACVHACVCACALFVCFVLAVLVPKLASRCLFLPLLPLSPCLMPNPQLPCVSLLCLPPLAFQMVVLSLILKRRRVRALVKDALLATSGFGPYVEVSPIGPIRNSLDAH